MSETDVGLSTLPDGWEVDTWPELNIFKARWEINKVNDESEGRL